VVLGAAVLPLLLLACGSAGDAAAVAPSPSNDGVPAADGALDTGEGAAPGGAAGDTSGAGSATGSAESSTGGAASGTVQAPTGVYAGTYVVPIEPELEAFARFDVPSVRFDVNGAELTLRYDLPELLLGEARRIAFRGVAGADGRYLLEGDEGTASCRPEASSWVCDEVLQSLQLDTDKLARLLAGLPDAEARARRSVADRFIVDPIGVLHVPLP
jgi:hypothetical protein